MIQPASGVLYRATGLVVASVLGFAGLSVAGAGAAGADPASPEVHVFSETGSVPTEAPEQCPADSVCMFWDADFTGGSMAWLVVTDEEIPVGSCADFDHELRANVSSVVNNTARDLSFHQDLGCEGDGFTLPAGARLSYVGTHYNDHIGSVML